MDNRQLGVGRVIAACFSVFLLRFRLLIVFAGIVIFFNFLAYFSLETLLPGIGILDAAETGSVLDYAGMMMALVIDGVASAVLGALVIHLTYDLMLNRPADPTTYLHRIAACIVPLVLVSTLSGIGIGIATLAFVIPGMILYTIWFVVVPAVVIEKTGLHSFTRSADLTRGYRWPIFGIIVLMWTVIFGFAMLIAVTLQSVPTIMTIALWIFVGFSYVLNALAAAIVYARLRELKEGVGVDDIAQIFA